MFLSPQKNVLPNTSDFITNRKTKIVARKSGPIAPIWDVLVHKYVLFPPYMYSILALYIVIYHPAAPPPPPHAMHNLMYMYIIHLRTWDLISLSFFCFDVDKKNYEDESIKWLNKLNVTLNLRTQFQIHTHSYYVCVEPVHMYCISKMHWSWQHIHVHVNVHKSSVYFPLSQYLSSAFSVYHLVS